MENNINIRRVAILWVLNRDYILLSFNYDGEVHLVKVQASNRPKAPSFTHGLGALSVCVLCPGNKKVEKYEFKLRVNIIDCQINKAELKGFKGLPGPNPQTLGASPCMKFLASASPQSRSFTLDVLPDMGAGVTLLRKNMVKGLSMKIYTS